jgi:hypothetical protein
LLSWSERRLSVAAGNGRLSLCESTVFQPAICAKDSAKSGWKPDLLKASNHSRPHFCGEEIMPIIAIIMKLQFVTADTLGTVTPDLVIKSSKAPSHVL